MFIKIATNSIAIMKDLVLNPVRVFRNINTETYKHEAYFLFSLSAFITFYKSFSIKMYKINFFSDEKINDILSLFNIPQVKWFMGFLSFFLFLLLIKFLCKLILKNCNQKSLFICYLTISGAAIMMQLIFFAIQSFFSQKLVYALSYIAFFWIIFLSILAIKNSQSTSFSKATIIYFASAIPIILIMGLPGVSPFMMWIVKTPVISP